jgi:solute carrier family 41
MVVASTAMSAACLSAIVLGSLVSGLVVLCRKLGRDPGAVATSSLLIIGSYPARR